MPQPLRAGKLKDADERHTCLKSALAFESKLANVVLATMAPNVASLETTVRRWCWMEACRCETDRPSPTRCAQKAVFEELRGCSLCLQAQHQRRVWCATLV